MKQWMKCCFPKSKEDINIKDKDSIEYKDEDVSQNKTNIQNKDNELQSKEKCDDNLKENLQDNQLTKQGQPLQNNNPQSISDVPSALVDKNNQSNNEPFIDYMQSNREITDEEIKQAPTLTLLEDEGNIFNGKEIKINAGGLIGGRNAKDGVALFGFAGVKKDNFKTDFELNCVASSINKDYPYVFVIYYQRDTKSYYIRAYSGKGSDSRILFVKLNSSYDLSLKQREIIYSGSTLFQITPINNNKAFEIVNLSTRDSSSNSNSNKLTFDSKTSEEINIGRDPKCTIAFPKDKSFSRVQTSIYYEKNNEQWVIIDGSKAKSSTNGTWVFGFHSFPIKDQMIIEILTLKIKIIVSSSGI